MENWELTWTRLTSLIEENIEKIPANTQGVYRLSYKSDDGNYYVFYAGKSEDIKNQLLTHLSESNIICVKNYIDTKSCFFRYAIISQDYVRAATEKQVYNYFEPTCNKIEPEGRDDIKVNLN